MHWFVYLLATASHSKGQIRIQIAFTTSRRTNRMCGASRMELINVALHSLFMFLAAMESIGIDPTGFLSLGWAVVKRSHFLYIL